MSHPILKIAVAQVAPEVGDMDANLAMIRKYHQQAKAE
jgi:hypothetical protein